MASKCVEDPGVHILESQPKLLNLISAFNIRQSGMFRYRQIGEWDENNNESWIIQEYVEVLFRILGVGIEVFKDVENRMPEDLVIIVMLGPHHIPPSARSPPAEHLKAQDKTAIRPNIHFLHY